MEKLTLSLEAVNNNSPYSFNELFKNIEDERIYENLLWQSIQSKNFKKLNHYLDKFVEYLFQMIDESDYIYFETEEYKKIEYYKKSIAYQYYDLIEEPNGNEITFNVDVFDIRDSHSKQIIKNDLTFNLGNFYREPMIINNGRKYMEQKKLSEIEQMCFIKDNYLLLCFSRNDCYIYDYRDKSKIKYID